MKGRAGRLDTQHPAAPLTVPLRRTSLGEHYSVAFPFSQLCGSAVGDAAVMAGAPSSS